MDKYLTYAANYNTKADICKLKGTTRLHKKKNHPTFSQKKILKPDAKLDLHGYSLYSAKLTLHKYLIDCYDKNIRSVLIITGKGRFNNGVL